MIPVSICHAAQGSKSGKHERGRENKDMTLFRNDKRQELTGTNCKPEFYT
jgi:hypothetical protein